MWYPALPKPWIATVVFSGSSPSRRASDCVTRYAPRPVASGRPRLPPRPQGLAGDHVGHVGASDGAILGRHPAHHALVGVDVGRGDVLVRPHHVRHRAHVGAGQALELEGRQRLRVDDHAALPAPVRDADDGALDGHPERERLDLLERHARVEADAALRRPPRGAVAAAVRLELARRAVVHAHGQRRHHALARLAQRVDHLAVDAGGLAHALHAADRILEHVHRGSPSAGRAVRRAPRPVPRLGTSPGVARFQPSSTDASAASMPRALSRVSACSAAGSESATTAPPTCRWARPFCKTSVRMTTEKSSPPRTSR